MNKLPLEGQTIVFTGTKKPTTVFEKIVQLGGNAIYFPLIKTKELIENYDEQMLYKAMSFDWLIFTSQNAVKYFCKKLKRFSLSSKDFSGKVAAVGDKTKELLEINGFSVDFIPSVFSADVFVKEFQSDSINNNCLFLKGNLAKDTLEKGIPNLQQWTVYETVENVENIESLINIIKEDEVIIVFASPSAVEVFALHIVPKVGWNKVKLASIGHVTTEKIESYGQFVTYQPKVYTMESVINEIINRKDVSDDRTKF